MELRLNPQYEEQINELGISPAACHLVALGVTLEGLLNVSALDELFNMDPKEIQSDLVLALQELTVLENGEYKLKIPLIQSEVVLDLYDQFCEILVEHGWNNGNHPNQQHLGMTKWKNNDETKKAVNKALTKVMNEYGAVDFGVVARVINSYYNVDDAQFLQNMCDFFKNNFFLSYKGEV